MHVLGTYRTIFMSMQHFPTYSWRGFYTSTHSCTWTPSNRTFGKLLGHKSNDPRSPPLLYETTCAMIFYEQHCCKMTSSLSLSVCLSCRSVWKGRSRISQDHQGERIHGWRLRMSREYSPILTGLLKASTLTLANHDLFRPAFQKCNWG